MWDQSWFRCTCPVVIRGTLAGKRISLSTAKFLPPEKERNLEAARDLALLWERADRVVRPPEYAAPSESQDHSSAPEPPSLPGIAMAVASYMAHACDIGNSEAQLGKKKLWIERRLVAFAHDTTRDSASSPT